MIYSHFSNKPIQFSRDWIYRNSGPSNFKPDGLWLSDQGAKDSWKDWCEEVADWPHRLMHETKFRVIDPKRILFIYSIRSLFGFTEEFSDGNHIIAGIRWDVVTKKYGGIMISPYQWSARLNHRTSWYYGWDCASGCVWDLSTIEEVK